MAGIMISNVIKAKDLGELQISQPTVNTYCLSVAYLSMTFEFQILARFLLIILINIVCAGCKCCSEEVADEVIR